MGEYKPTVAVDFDGVIHTYSKGWQDGTIYDPPVPGTLEALQKLKAAGYRLVLFTTRGRTVGGLEDLRDWLAVHELLSLFDEITATKPPAVAYLDDRAVPFHGMWSPVLAKVDELRHDGTWQARLQAAVAGDPAPGARHAARVLRHLGPLLRDTRKRRGLTLAQAMHEVGVSVAWLGQIEQGAKRPSLDLALKLLDWIGADPAAAGVTTSNAHRTTPAAPAPSLLGLRADPAAAEDERL